MSIKNPVIAITGSSGAGTTSVTRAFQHIFRREKLNAAIIEGDSFHRYDRLEMRAKMAETGLAGDHHFSHFGPEANLLAELAGLFREYGESGLGRTRHYVHDDVEAELYGSPPGTFTEWTDLPENTDLLFYEGLHAAATTIGACDEILRVDARAESRALDVHRTRHRQLGLEARGAGVGDVVVIDRLRTQRLRGTGHRYIEGAVHDAYLMLMMV